MDIVVLYGPPGVGKLTIGKELAATTNFKLLDNHLFFNIGIELYERFSPELDDLYAELHLLTFKHALKHQVSGIITTVCASDPRQWRVWSQIDSSVSCQFVQLRCDESELLKRVESKDRALRGKLDDASLLKEVLSSEDYGLTHKEVISLDVTSLSASQAANFIVERLGQIKAA